MFVRSPHFIVGSALVALVVGFVPLYLFRSFILTERPPIFITQDTLPVPAAGFKLPPINNTAFKAGEKLHYDIIFKGLTVGHATIEITNGPMVNGRPTLKYTSKAESTHFFDLFFKVRDENTSTVDKASLFSLSFDQNLSEGHYRALRRYDFDYLHKKFTTEEKREGKIKKSVGTLQAPLFDVLSVMYFARTIPLSPGRDIVLSIYRDKAGKPLPIRIGSSLKTKKTPFGTFSCLRVEPLLQGDSIFKSKEGGLVVWITNDEKKLPILMEANSTVGLIRVKLMKWEN